MNRVKSLTLKVRICKRPRAAPGYKARIVRLRTYHLLSYKLLPLGEDHRGVWVQLENALQFPYVLRRLVHSQPQAVIGERKSSNSIKLNDVLQDDAKFFALPSERDQRQPSVRHHRDDSSA